MSLDTVQDIERAIDALTPEQREELLAWVDEQYATAVDLQLKEDLHAGRLDDRIHRALADHKAGRTHPL